MWYVLAVGERVRVCTSGQLGVVENLRPWEHIDSKRSGLAFLAGVEHFRCQRESPDPPSSTA